MISSPITQGAGQAQGCGFPSPCPVMVAPDAGTGLAPISDLVLDRIDNHAEHDGQTQASRPGGP